MSNPELESFKHQILYSADHPFRYPHPPYRVPFVVGGEQIVEWCKMRYKESLAQGSKISYIVGVPGAGKSHLLSHLEYLFYESHELNGLYATYDARGSEIDEAKLWASLFASESVIDKIKQTIDATAIKNPRIDLQSRANLAKLLEDPLQVSRLDADALHNMMKSLDKLLLEKRVGICIAVDNIDEYVRVANEKYEKEFGKEVARDRVAASLFGTIRNATSGLDQIFLLLACTEDVARQLDEAKFDLTYGRRIEHQDRHLGRLSPDQSLELVNKYLDWWARRNNVELPVVDDNECSYQLPTGEKISIYPFSVNAVKYFTQTTRSVAGDVVCLCGQCVNNMRGKGNVSVVKGADIQYAIEEAQVAYPQLVVNFDIVKRDRPLYMKDLMELRLNDILDQMKNPISDSTRIISAMEAYSLKLGVGKISPPPVAHDYRDGTTQVVLGNNSKIWSYGDKRILVKYIIGSHPPLGKKGLEFGYDKKIETQDKLETISYLEDASVTHVLFISRWADTFSQSSLWPIRLRAVIGEFNVDGDGRFGRIDRIVGVVEDAHQYSRDVAQQEQYKNDLLQHIEKFHVNLLSALNSLVERSSPEESLEERRRRDKQALATGVS